MNVTAPQTAGIVLLVIFGIGMAWYANRLQDQRRILSAKLENAENLAQSNCEREFLTFVRMIIAMKHAPRGTQMSVRPLKLEHYYDHEADLAPVYDFVSFDTFEVSGSYQGTFSEDYPEYRIYSLEGAAKPWCFVFYPASPDFAKELNSFYEFVLREDKNKRRGATYLV